jgi:hypothetical protein
MERAGFVFVLMLCWARSTPLQAAAADGEQRAPTRTAGPQSAQGSRGRPPGRSWCQGAGCGRRAYYMDCNGTQSFCGQVRAGYACMCIKARASRHELELMLMVADIWV